MNNTIHTLPTHLRNPSAALSGSQPSQSNILLSRIAEKKAELDALKDLQALSAGLADQMQALVEKLTTLSDGTEAVAAVLSNWHNVLRAIKMASTMSSKPKAEDTAEKQPDVDLPLPQTLVRIPTQHAQTVIPRPSTADNPID